MKISTLLNRNSVFSQTTCTSKKCALEKISNIAAQELDLDPRVLFQDLIAREKIGSTGVGCGIAIPHVKISSDLPATAVFLQCEYAIDYDANDGKKVDILFAIFVPENLCKQYLSALSEISKMLLDKKFSRQLRDAQNNQQLFELLTI